MEAKTYLAVEDLEVYRKLCRLHLDVCDLTHEWPQEERYELGSQVRRSSNSSPSQLAEKNDDRHVRNKIEGVNRSRGEAGETVHHLYMAFLKKYLSQETFGSFRGRYQECVRMLNGLERTLEQKLPISERRWQVSEDRAAYGSDPEFSRPGWPASDLRHLVVSFVASFVESCCLASRYVDKAPDKARDKDGDRFSCSVQSGGLAPVAQLTPDT